MTSIAYQLLKEHLLEGELRQGEEIKIKIDQTLTQDSTGTMVYLQLEAMAIDDIRTELSVAYIDHNMLQTGFEIPTTTSLFNRRRQNTGWSFPNPVAASATKCSWNNSPHRARPW